MKIDTTTLSPWAEIISILGRMSSLTIWVNGVPYSGEAELSRDESTGEVRLAFETAPVERDPPYPPIAKPKKVAKLKAA